jgi:hypothetical protein
MFPERCLDVVVIARLFMGEGLPAGRLAVIVGGTSSSRRTVRNRRRPIATNDGEEGGEMAAPGSDASGPGDRRLEGVRRQRTAAKSKGELRARFKLRAGQRGRSRRRRSTDGIQAVTAGKAARSDRTPRHRRMGSVGRSGARAISA